MPPIASAASEICGRERRQRVKSNIAPPRWLGVGENQRVPRGSLIRARMTRTGAAPISRSRAGNETEAASVFVAAALREEGRARLITSDPLPRTMRARVPRNTSSCLPRQPRPTRRHGSRWESARASRGGGSGARGRRGAAFLFLPNLPRERDAMGDEAVASAAISWDPPGYSFIYTYIYVYILTESCVVIDAWSSRRGYPSSLFLLSVIFLFFFLSFLPLFFYGVFLPLCRALYFSDNKALRHGSRDIVYTRYPDTRLIIGGLLSLLVRAPERLPFAIVDHRGVQRPVLPLHTNENQQDIQWNNDVHKS